MIVLVVLVNKKGKTECIEQHITPFINLNTTDHAKKKCPKYDKPTSLGCLVKALLIA